MAGDRRLPEPYFVDEHVTLYLADCLDILPLIEPVDLAITSPPYNMGLVPGGNGRGMYKPGANNKGGRFREGYGVHDDAMAQDDYDGWQRAVLAALWAKVRLGIFYNHRPRVEHGKLRVPLGWDYGDLTLRQVITWDRGTGIDVNKRAFCTRGEWIMLFAKPEFSLVDHAASGMGDVWRISPETGVKDHPAPFPIALPAKAIEAVSPASVIDPFCGSGSTLVAAKAAGVRAIGVENHEPYCELAVRRLAQGVLV